MAELAASRLTLDDLFAVAGYQDHYSLSDAQRLHKKQLTVSQYRSLFDMDEHYSQSLMLEILRLRCKYVIQRGSTLNNPKVPKTELEKFPMITYDHAKELRKLVSQALNS